MIWLSANLGVVLSHLFCVIRNICVSPWILLLCSKGDLWFCVLPSVSRPDGHVTDSLSQIVKLYNAFKSKGLKTKWLLQFSCNYWNRCKITAVLRTLAFVLKSTVRLTKLTIVWKWCWKCCFRVYRFTSGLFQKCIWLKLHFNLCRTCSLPRTLTHAQTEDGLGFCTVR